MAAVEKVVPEDARTDAIAREAAARVRLNQAVAAVAQMRAALLGAQERMWEAYAEWMQLGGKGVVLVERTTPDRMNLPELIKLKPPA